MRDFQEKSNKEKKRRDENPKLLLHLLSREVGLLKEEEQSIEEKELKERVEAEDTPRGKTRERGKRKTREGRSEKNTKGGKRHEKTEDADASKI